MTHDYQQYKDATGATLQYRIGCDDCDWINRRSYMQAAERSQRHHERKTGHDVTIEDDGGPFDD